jgi:two-component system NtrC family sensor kinase
MLIARQAAVAIENARLFDAQRGEQRQTEAAAEIARAALRKVTVAEASHHILSILEDVVPSSGKAIGIISPDGVTITFVAARGSCEPMEGISGPVESSAVRVAWAREEPTFVENLRENAHNADRVPDAPAITIPLIASTRRLGVLVVTSETAQLQAGPAADALLRLAPAVALAIDVLILSEEEQRTHARERTLAAALATMDQPVLILGVDAKVQYGNAAAIKEYRYEANEITGLSVDDFVVASAEIPPRQTIPPIPSDKPLWIGEHIHRRKDGTEFPAAVTLSHIRDGRDNIVGLVIGIRNLTEERKVADHLGRTEKLAAIGELVAGVAHELNNPLTGISTFAQLLLEDNLEGEQFESVSLIKREADRAIGVIRDLLLFARKTDARDVPVDINTIVKHTVRLRALASRSAGIEVHMRLDESNPRTRGDEQKLQQVLLNLVINAEQAMLSANGGGILVVRTWQDADQESVVLEINDDGPGIPDELQPKIFDPFFTTKEVGQGTGLGLTVAYAIVQEHGGRIRLESRPGAGASFYVELPVTGAPLPPVQAARPPDDPIEAIAGASILVVEDEAKLASAVVDALRDAGYIVEHAPDGEAALGKVKGEAFDLVICDLKMPRVDGMAFYRELSAAAPGLSRRVIFVTGDVAGTDAETFLEESGCRWLAKPFRLGDLLRAVRDTLS